MALTSSAVSDAFGMFWKAAFFFLLLVALLRIMGKREIGSLSSIDLVVFFMISEAAIISVEDKKVPLLVGIVPVATLALMEIISSWASLKSQKVRALLEGRPTIVIDRGKVQEKALASQRFDIDNLLAQLRQKNIPNVGDVEYAIMETSGQLSVIPKTQATPATAQDVKTAAKDAGGLDLTPPGGQQMPLSLIIDGEVNQEALRMVGRDEDWLSRQLHAQGVRRKSEVLLAVLDPGGNLLLQRKATSGGGAPGGTGQRSGKAGGGKRQGGARGGGGDG